jgi:hypothetical protein
MEVLLDYFQLLGRKVQDGENKAQCNFGVCKNISPFDGGCWLRRYGGRLAEICVERMGTLAKQVEKMPMLSA